MNSPLEVIKRHKSQLVFLLVTLGLMCPAVYFLSLEITELRQWMFQFSPPAHGFPMWADFYYSLGSCAVSWVLLALVKRLTWDFFAGVCKE